MVVGDFPVQGTDTLFQSTNTLVKSTDMLAQIIDTLVQSTDTLVEVGDVLLESTKSRHIRDQSNLIRESMEWRLSAVTARFGCAMISE